MSTPPPPRPRAARAVLAGAALLLAPAPNASAMTITPTWSASVNALPNATEVKAAFQAAASTYEAMFVNPVTIQVQVGWGEILGSPVSSIGVSGMYGYGSYSYAQMTGMLGATATSTADRTAYSTFPATSPVPGTFTLTPAQAKALGVAPPTSSAMDGYIGFGAGYAFDFSRADGIAAGTYDFVGVALHEISHVLGRVSGLGGGTATNGLAMDMFRYKAPGTASFAYSEPAYFSINGGRDNLATFNAAGTADRDSWTTLPGDAFSAYASPGVVNDLSVADRIVMDVLGWNTVPGTTTPAWGGTTAGTTTGGTAGGGRGGTKRKVEVDADLAVFAAGAGVFVPTGIKVPAPPALPIFAAALAALALVRRRTPMRGT